MFPQLYNSALRPFNYMHLYLSRRYISMGIHYTSLQLLHGCNPLEERLKHVSLYFYIRCLSFIRKIIFWQSSFCIQPREMGPATIADDPSEAVAKTKCQGADCEKDAGTLRCPACLKLGKESFFCSQECFKRNWVRALMLPLRSPFDLTK